MISVLNTLQLLSNFQYSLFFNILYTITRPEMVFFFLMLVMKLWMKESGFSCIVDMVSTGILQTTWNIAGL